MTKKLKKNYSRKKIKKIFGSKTTIYLSLGLQKERLSYRRSLQLSKEAIQHFKTWTCRKIFYFCGSFLPSWIRIRIPNPDPQPWLIRSTPRRSTSSRWRWPAPPPPSPTWCWRPTRSTCWWGCWCTVTGPRTAAARWACPSSPPPLWASFSSRSASPTVRLWRPITAARLRSCGQLLPNIRWGFETGDF